MNTNNLFLSLQIYWILKGRVRAMNKHEDDVCDFCQGVGKSSSQVCVYCNGTGDWNHAAQAYVKNHICQCIVLDRKFCPICNKSCHHGTSLNPKQKIDPGNGGMSSQESYKTEIAAV